MILIQHICMFVLLIGLGILILRSIEYCKILVLNLNHASMPRMKAYLDTPIDNKTFIKTERKYMFWLFVVLPMTIVSWILTSIIWWYVSIIGNIELTLLIISVIQITTTLTISIVSEPYPDWLFKWIIVLGHTQKRITIEIIEAKLTEAREQLLDVIHNRKQLSEIELDQLKYEALFLSREMFVLSGDNAQADEIQKLLNQKKA